MQDRWDAWPIPPLDPPLPPVRRIVIVNGKRTSALRTYLVTSLVGQL